MSVRRGPRPVGAALRDVRATARPATQLAAVQGAWARAAGAAVSREAEPVAEREGVVTIACHSATWAQELDLLQTELLGRLNDALAEAESGPPTEPVRGLRFTADAARHF